jgi:hypothetical protein
MARHTATATPSIGLWSSVESAVSLTLKSLSSSPAEDRSFVEFTEAQDRIRRSSRHWLIG